MSREDDVQDRQVRDAWGPTPPAPPGLRGRVLAAADAGATGPFWRRPGFRIAAALAAVATFALVIRQGTRREHPPTQGLTWATVGDEDFADETAMYELAALSAEPARAPAPP
jgi:hypothetical protein